MNALGFSQKLFADYWHLLCHRRELPENNDYIKFNTPVGDVVVFNDAGELVAFDNRCPHRGRLMFSETHGRQPATCSYHGWTYAHGNMIIPSAEIFSDCAVENADLKKFKIDWVGDFLFIGIAPKFDLYDQLKDVAGILENISFNIDRRLDFDSYDYKCHWPLAIENALEPYHIDMVHSSTLATLNLESGVNKYFGVNSVWETKIGDEGVNKKLTRIGGFFNIDYQHKGYINIFIFPFAMISSTFGFSYSLQNFFPDKESVTNTHFYSRLLTSNLKNENSRHIVGGFLDSTAKINRRIFKEDYEVCSLMPLDSWSIDPLKYPSSLEERIDHFRAVCREVLKK